MTDRELRMGDEIFIEVPRTGGSDTAVFFAYADGGESLIVLLGNHARRIPRSWMFDPEEENREG